jgi:hypothetical protein
MQLKVLPERTKNIARDDNGNSTDPADWQAGLLGIASEFAKVAADNLKTSEVRQQEQSLARQQFNWRPWAVGGGLVVGGLVVLKMLKVF